MKIPTTLEMDGIFTEEDKANRFYVIRTCLDCGGYTKADIRADKLRAYSCAICKGPRYDYKTQNSIRTHMALREQGKVRKTPKKIEKNA